MLEWNAKTLLDLLQEMLGEPEGAFYNISSRLRLMNAAQIEMVQETRAITAVEDIPIEWGEREYDVPQDFLTFDLEPPYIVVGGAVVHPLEVIDPDLLSRRDRLWRSEQHPSGTPLYAILRGQTLTLHPSPASSGTLVLPYVVAPLSMDRMEDFPFNAKPHLNRFAPALAYRAAQNILTGRAPQVADNFRGLYEREERLMRHALRSSPQHKPGIRPDTERRSREP